MRCRAHQKDNRWSRITWLLLLLTTGTALAVPDVGTRGRDSGEQVKPRKIWAGRGVDFTGSPSPDGRYLTFVDWSTGDLAVRDVASGENRRLTNKGSWGGSEEYAEASIVSPDSRQIAYAWFNGEFYDLRLVDMGGSEPRILYRNAAVDYLEPGGWSPDGKFISLHLTASATSEIALVSVVDGSVRVLKRVESSDLVLGPFSPDGRYLLYDRSPRRSSPERDIFLLAIDGSREVHLVNHPADDSSVAWSPDGRRVVFLSDRQGAIGFWFLPVADGQAQGLPELIQSNLPPMTPLGVTSEGALYYGLHAGIRDSYIARLDPGTGRVIGTPKLVSQDSVGSNRLPAWSPDGRYLAYLSLRDSRPGSPSSPRLVIRSLETGQQRELAPTLAFQPPWSPLCWSSDGRFILAAGVNEEGRQGLFRIDARTAEVTAMVLNESRTRTVMPFPSLDGKTIFYLREDFTKDSSSIVRHELETGREKELYRAIFPSFVNTFAVSPDGRQLVFRVGDENYAILDVLKIIPVGEGEPRELLRATVPENHDISGLTGIAWAPDGKYILFGRFTGEPQAEQPVRLLRMAVDGGEPQHLGLVMHRIWAVRIHPNGDRIAFTAGDVKPEVWVLEDFVPSDEREK